MPRRSSALTGSSNQRTPCCSMPAANRLASATLNVPWASTIRSMSSPRARPGGCDPCHARLDGPVDHADAHLHRAGTRRRRSGRARRRSPSASAQPPLAYSGHVVAARAAPQVDDGDAERATEQVPQGHVDAADRRRPSGRDGRGSGRPAPATRRSRRAGRCTAGPPAALIRRGSWPTSAGPSSSLMHGDERATRAGAADGRLRLAPPDVAVVGLDAHQRHVEAVDAPEVGDVLALRRDRAVQPAGASTSRIFMSATSALRSAAAASWRTARRACCRSPPTAGCCRGR